MDSTITGEKMLTTNGMVQGSGIVRTVANILVNGHQFIMSENATAESILQGIHKSKVK